MKIIDVLNKIANGEEVPKKILYKYSYKDFYKVYCLKWDKKYKGYYTTNDKAPITHLLADNLWNLNDEIEIIEEDKKIEKIEQRTDTGLIGTDSVDMIEHTNRINRQAGYLSEIVSKINEIIDYIIKGD